MTLLQCYIILTCDCHINAGDDTSLKKDILLPRERGRSYTTAPQQGHKALEGDEAENIGRHVECSYDPDDHVDP